MFQTPPSRKRKHSGSTSYSERQSKYRKLISSGVSVATGVPQPIVEGAARILFPDLEPEPNSRMATGQIASVRNTRTVVRGKKYRKQAKIARQISNLSAVHVYRVTQGQRVTTFHTGRQMYTTLGFDAGATNPVTGNLGLGLLNVGDLNKVQSLIAGNLAVGTLGYRFVIKKAVSEYMLTNSTTGNITLTLYDFVPRKDIYAVANSNVYPPDLAIFTGMTTTWQAGNITQAAATQYTDSDPASYPGVTPFASSLFCSFYKVIAVKKLCLSPGVCYKHVVCSYPRKIWDDNAFFDKSVANVAATDIAYLAKHTVLTMMYIEGMPSHGPTPNFFVTTGLAAVDVVQNKTYMYAYGPAPQRSLQTFADLPTNIAVDNVPEATGVFVTESTHI